MMTEDDKPEPIVTPETIAALGLATQRKAAAAVTASKVRRQSQKAGKKRKAQGFGKDIAR